MCFEKQWENYVSQEKCCINSAYWVILHAFLSSADFFQNQRFLKILSGIPSECQTIWINILSGVIWVQTVCKHYQQTTLVGKELKVRL